MKKKKQLVAGFKTHLETLGYSKATVHSAIYSMRDFTGFLSEENMEFAQADTGIINHYFESLHQRPNKKKPGGLTTNYIAKYRHGLKLFYDFLHLKNIPHQKVVLPVFKKERDTVPAVLTLAEIKSLFEACENTLLGERNKAIIALYYGCGLRRSEGINLNLQDVDMDKGYIHIRKSKTHRERMVPLSDQVATVLDNYIFNVREKLVPSGKQQPALIVTLHGKRLHSETPRMILRKLCKESKNASLIKKDPGLHTLRHSIATHLLQSGMKLENIGSC